MSIEVYLKTKTLAIDGVETIKVESVCKCDSNKYKATMSTNGVLKIQEKNATHELVAAFSPDSWSFMVTE